MRKLLLGIFIVSLLVCASCSSSGADTNQSANSDTNPLGYAGANLALAEGTRFLDTGDIDKAIDALSEAVKLNPDLAEAWFKLGIAYALSEKRDNMLERPDVEEPVAEKTRTRTNSEKAFLKAVVAYKKIIEANGADDVAYFNLGRAYNKLNEDQDAAKALKQAVNDAVSQMTDEQILALPEGFSPHINQPRYDKPRRWPKQKD